MSVELDFPILLVSPAGGSATRSASGSAPKQSYRYLTNAFYECQPPNVAKISDLKNAVIETVHEGAPSLNIDDNSKMSVRIYQLEDSLRPDGGFVSQKRWQEAYQVVDGAYLEEKASELFSNKALAALEKHAQENVVAVLTVVPQVPPVSTPPASQEDMVSQLISIRLSDVAKRPYKAPSSEAQPSMFRNRQQNPELMIFCGRPNEHVLPPSLLDETLCELRYNLVHITPSAKDVQDFQALCQTAARTFEDEDERRNEFTGVMRRVLPDEPRRGFVGPKFHDDGDLRATVFESEPSVMYYVQEVKNEVSTGGGDPYVEVIHYWIEQARLFTPGIKCAVFNFPAVLVTHFGPYLAIAAAAFADRPTVEHLACIPLHSHSTNLAERASGERAVAALRVAAHALRERYPNMVSTKKTLANHPFRDFFECGAGKYVFKYDAAIENKRVFYAHREDSEPEQRLCIKFSIRYSEAAHRAAHAINVAPELYAVNRVGDWYMVVMEDVSKDFETLFELKRQGWRSQKVQEAVTAHLARVHEAGFVHGDMRDVNVLVRLASLDAPSPHVLLVDWDWSGPINSTAYPANINREDILRPTDAMGGTQITPEHDVWMSEHLFS